MAKRKVDGKRVYCSGKRQQEEMLSCYLFAGYKCEKCFKPFCHRHVKSESHICKSEVKT